MLLRTQRLGIDIVDIERRGLGNCSTGAAQRHASKNNRQRCAENGERSEHLLPAIMQ